MLGTVDHAVCNPSATQARCRAQHYRLRSDTRSPVLMIKHLCMAVGRVGTAVGGTCAGLVWAALLADVGWELSAAADRSGEVMAGGGWGVVPHADGASLALP